MQKDIYLKIVICTVFYFLAARKNWKFWEKSNNMEKKSMAIFYEINRHVRWQGCVM